MSFTPVNLAPGCVVTCGIVALVLGYTTLGLWLIGVPFALGILALVFAVIAAVLQKPNPPES